MEQIKIIFFDIDGTLLDPATDRISPLTVQTVNRLRANGIKVCVSTGRPPASLPDLSALPFDALLTTNGGLCYTASEVFYKLPIPSPAVQQVIANAAALGRPVSIAVQDRLAANGWEQDLADYYVNAGLVLTVAEDFEEVARQDVYQIMMCYRPEDHDALLENTQGLMIAQSWERAADIIPAGGKGNGIRKALAYFQVDPSQAMAFGDSFNDIEMLQAVQYGVAMGNAIPQLKEIAWDVCGPVSDDGIYHYCLEKGLI